MDVQFNEVMGIIVLLAILLVIAVGWAVKEGVKRAFKHGVCPECGADTEVYCDKLTGDIYYVCTKCDYVVNWDDEDEKDQVQDEQGRD